jgi:serine/threonine-protein kinase
MLDHGDRRTGKYEILARLSVGGMAEVFLAVTTGPGGFRKLVVLKRVLPQHRDERDFVDMFLDEARITAALSHSCIAQVFDLGDEGGELYLVMEFVAGQDVSAVRRAALQRGMPVPIGLSCRIVRDVCLALHYAHHFVDPGGAPLPVIHRDISPRNVMVTYAGGVKIIDFGIAKAKGLLERTQDGLMKGSVGYMSPEQTLGGQLDGRSDLFSAAVILHELLTGRRLFRVAGDTRATVDRLFGEAVLPPHQLNPRAPSALSPVVLRGLERDRADRYEDGVEMARAIEGAVGGDLFDDERVAAFMRDLFADDIARARHLLGGVGGGAPRGLAAEEILGQFPSSISSDSKESVTMAGTPASGPAVSWRTPPVRNAAATEEPPVILAVDDSGVGRKLAELHLGKAGFHVVTASSPSEALEMLAEMRPHLILLDVIMPGMNGFELCKRIREQLGPATPIVFVSAACSLDERTQGLDAGADDFVRKPYDPGDLVGRVRGHLRRVASLRSSSEGRPAVGRV